MNQAAFAKAQEPQPIKVACEHCITGHRTGTCGPNAEFHTPYQENVILLEVRRSGRPDAAELRARAKFIAENGEQCPCQKTWEKCKLHRYYGRRYCCLENSQWQRIRAWEQIEDVDKMMRATFGVYRGDDDPQLGNGEKTMTYRPSPISPQPYSGVGVFDQLTDLTVPPTLHIDPSVSQNPAIAISNYQSLDHPQSTHPQFIAGLAQYPQYIADTVSFNDTGFPTVFQGIRGVNSYRNFACTDPTRPAADSNTQYYSPLPDVHALPSNGLGFGQTVSSNIYAAAPFGTPTNQFRCCPACTPGDCRCGICGTNRQALNGQWHPGCGRSTAIPPQFSASMLAPGSMLDIMLPQVHMDSDLLGVSQSDMSGQCCSTNGGGDPEYGNMFHS
ncbi:hypothetical protein LTR66_005779 [Elasticomyces elasticus]|nr:hypothetical protein LTR66_005779 [Elasticomyces elasticus]